MYYELYFSICPIGLQTIPFFTVRLELNTSPFVVKQLVSTGYPDTEISFNNQFNGSSCIIFVILTDTASLSASFTFLIVMVTILWFGGHNSPILRNTRTESGG